MANDSQFIGSGGSVSVTAPITGDGSPADPIDVAVDNVTVVIAGGVLTAPGGGGGTIGGNVGATDNRIVRVDGTGTATIQGSSVGLTDAGVMTGASIAGSQITGAYTSSAMTLGTSKLLGRTTSSTGVVEELALGANVATAIGTAVGSAGAFVVNGGALGTPSSGTGTNLTGIPEGGLSLTNVTTNNATTSRHGFLPILSNVALQYLDGTGNFTIPAGSSGGQILPAYLAVTGNHTLDWSTDGLVELTTNAGTFTLPTAVGHSGSGFAVKNAQTANALTLATTGGQQIDGASPGTLTNGALILISNGASWRLESDLGLAVTSLTSGGVIYADTAASIASSALLAANNPVLGGGAGTAPATVAGIDSDGVSVLILGQAGSSTGGIQYKNTTSGTLTVQAAATGALSGTLTYPIATDTLIGKATADVLTNKTFDTAGSGNVFKINTEAVSSIGSGLDITSGVLDVSGAGGLTSAFTSAVVAGQTTITSSGSQALTIVAGTNVTLTTDNTAKSLTIDASGGGGGTFPAISVYLSGDQTGVTTATETAIAFDTEIFDTNSNFNTTDHKFTPTVAGKYQVSLSCYISGTSLISPTSLLLYKNTTEMAEYAGIIAGSHSQVFLSYLVDMNGTTDFLIAKGYATCSGTATFVSAPQVTYFTAVRVGA